MTLFHSATREPVDCVTLAMIDRAARRWPVRGYTSTAVPKSLRKAEATIHELCHCAVFGIDATKIRRAKQTWDDNPISDLVASRFDRYGSPRNSDARELHALAVEVRVFEILSLPLDTEELLFGVQWKHSKSSGLAEKRLARRLKLASDGERVAQVLRWIRRTP